MSQTLYNVSTKEINQAVSNNPNKFPNGYVIEVNKITKSELVKNFDRFNSLKHSTAQPKAFTEKGLYMLATIIKSEVATKTTIDIIETFSKIRELSRNVNTLSAITDKKEQQSLMQKSGELITQILDNNLQTAEAETTIELNFAVLKFKHTVLKKK
ncbi:MAG TPA: DNA-binding protein [Lentisphaeria bacterium]|nr:DNA-binding protein [Lentisphaeria bacterium]